MPITQQTLFGSSIRGIQAKIGWGNQLSTCTVDLVEDPRHSGINGPGYDFFNPSPVGTPTYFTFQNAWTFNGILQSSRIFKDINGNTVQQVTLVDPREVLDGVQLILRGYNGQTFVAGSNEIYNLFNIFGYLEEKLGFGGSQSNETGIPWKLVKDTLTELANNSLTANPQGYGSYIYLNNFQYKIALNQLNFINLPSDYRVAADSISVMEFIDDVCKAASYDYFFTLQSGIIPGQVEHFITLNLAERQTQPTFGKISQFLLNTPNVVSSDTGFEFRNDITSKFLVGGDRIDMYVQPYQSGDPDIYDDDTIWPYWGKHETGATIGFGFNNYHYFALDSKGLKVTGVGDIYISNVAEMRAAAVSREAWEMFLWMKDKPQNDGNINPQLGRATAIKLIGNSNKDWVEKAINVVDVNPAPFQNLTKEQIAISSKTGGTENEEVIGRLYDFVRTYATEFYGRKFMVRIPQVETYYDYDQSRIRHTTEPADAGYIDETQFSGAILSNLLPTAFTRLTDGQGRFNNYVRFDNAQDLDYTEISTDDIVFNNFNSVSPSSVFIKCSLDDTIQFVHTPTRFSPRVIATLPGAVRNRTTERFDAHGLLKTVFNKMLASGQVTQTQYDNALGRFGKDTMNYPNEGMCLLPSVAVVALKSNTQTYGPWWAIGAKGKLEFEKDDSLVPWNYGGYANMDVAGRAKVNEALSHMQVSEGGTVEFPGIPSNNLGSQLVAGGPYITDIQINIDTQAGVSTKYLLNTWTPQFGTLFKQNSERIQKVGKINQQIRNKFRELNTKDYRPETVGKFTQVKVRSLPSDRVKSHSSHFWCVGENLISSGIKSPGPEVYFGIPNPSPAQSGMLPPSGEHWYNLMHSNVCIQPHQLTSAQLKEELYAGKAGFTIDGLFRPFIAASGVDGIVGQNPVVSGLLAGLPRFRTPASGAVGPTVAELNPFSDGHDINAMIRESGYPIDLVYDNIIPPEIRYTDLPRGMGIRFPMVGVGWGLDNQGKPVPNKSGDNSSTEYLDDYRKRPQDWAVGPVDFRWNHSRGIWEAGGGAKISDGFLIDTLNAPTSDFCPASARVKTPVSYGVGECWNSGLNSSYYKIERIYNRDPSLNGSNGSYVQYVEYPNGEKKIIWIECQQ